MAITISGENNNDKILASDGVIDQLSGFSVVGVMTATSFTGDLTGDVTGNLTGNVTGNINNSTLLLQTGGTERLRITGNNEIGIAGGNYGSSGQVFTSGGTNSPVSWTTPAVTAFTNGSNNRVITATSGSGLNGEANLTFDGTKLGVGVASPDGNLHVQSSSAGSVTAATDANELVLESTSNVGMSFLTANNAFTRIKFSDPDATNAGIIIYSHSDDSLRFAHTSNERLRISSVGHLGVGDNNPDTRLSVTAASGTDVVGKFTSTDARAWVQFRDNSTTDTAVMVGAEGDNLLLRSGSNTRVTVDSSGRILYGLTSNFSGAKLQLNLGAGGNAINIFAASNDANAATLDLYKSRGTTPSNYTALQDGDFIGELRFKGSTGSSYVNGAVIQAKVNGTTGSGNDLPTDLIFRLQPDGSGNTGEVFRIAGSGKVLVGDGNVVSPSRHLDVRGSGHQQILIGSTNNAGASLMVDGHGGGDGSGGNYGSFEMASDGHLKIRNYDPAKSIIFGTGSNTGSNDRVTIASNGKTSIINAELAIESSASYTTHLNYNNTGINYISTTNGGATYFRGSSNSLTSLVAHGGGNVELPTANYEFTENNFKSKSSATENGNTAQFSNAMTSLMGSYHSCNNTNGIMDFPDYKASDWTVLEVYGKANPNTAGSGAYSDPFFMTIYKGGGYTYPNVVTTIFAVVHTPAARTMYSSGTGNNANDGITAVWYNGSSESREFTYNNSNNAANYLRIKVPTGHFNTTYGMSFACRIFKRF